MNADIPGISVLANSVPAWIPNLKGKDISSDVNTESHWESDSVLPFSQKISSSVDTDIPGFPFKFYRIRLGEDYGWMIDGGW
ncbi:uncharacterized protein OCT59_010454 [Rhizophagus irregularis]|uniref:uncharacterized protein n=1 Tax=Rhizophagus irregularis TaxID=588596 RepID=UPI003320AE38|nr:hypothetical protein OCT59_010454 [Rhizophagus irregularis]